MSDADEVAELKYEAAKWKRAHDAVESKLMEVCEESVRLRAKVERLETQINETVPVQISVSPHQMAEYMQKHRPVFHKQINDQEDEIKRLKAEVERLRKAGDAMALCITEFRCGKHGNALDKVGGFYVWQDWLAAKEGKTQP